MAKAKTAFVCNECGSDYSKWQGQCADCQAWNTLVEFKLGPASSGSSKRSAPSPLNAHYAGAQSQAQTLA